MRVFDSADVLFFKKGATHFLETCSIPRPKLGRPRPENRAIKPLLPLLVPFCRKNPRNRQSLPVQASITGGRRLLARWLPGFLAAKNARKRGGFDHWVISLAGADGRLAMGHQFSNDSRIWKSNALQPQNY
jgi:hypothetical protein